MLYIAAVKNFYMVSKILVFALMLLLFVLKLSFVIKGLFQITQSTHTSVSRCLDAGVRPKYLHWIHWTYIHKKWKWDHVKISGTWEKNWVHFLYFNTNKGQMYYTKPNINSCEELSTAFFQQYYYILCFVLQESVKNMPVRCYSVWIILK